MGEEQLSGFQTSPDSRSLSEGTNDGAGSGTFAPLSLVSVTRGLSAALSPL